jgi:hypothetical protein
MSNTVYCFSANRICHHDEYANLVSKIRKSVNVKSSFKKILILLSNKPIIFFDIDKVDLYFYPLMALRSLWKANSIAISVRTEYLCNRKSFSDFLFQRGRMVALIALIKRFLFYLIKKTTRTKVYSIHKDTPNTPFFSKYVSDFIYDPQLWDLNILKSEEIIPYELENKNINIADYILFAGSFDEKRSKSEFIKYLKICKDLKFIIAGIIEQKDQIELSKFENVFIINRFTTNEELAYLMSNCQVIYCFYSNDRPSGFFGRALQLNKRIIVRKNSFLENNFSPYKNLYPISDLKMLNKNTLFLNLNFENLTKYDDSSKFIKIINEM